MQQLTGSQKFDFQQKQFFYFSSSAWHADASMTHTYKNTRYS
jgi:hypothetical protein